MGRSWTGKIRPANGLRCGPLKPELGFGILLPFWYNEFADRLLYKATLYNTPHESILKQIITEHPVSRLLTFPVAL
jgi:hypothetical protein